MIISGESKKAAEYRIPIGIPPSLLHPRHPGAPPPCPAPRVPHPTGPDSRLWTAYMLLEHIGPETGQMWVCALPAEVLGVLYWLTGVVSTWWRVDAVFGLLVNKHLCP
jgi:hypothetical protein